MIWLIMVQIVFTSPLVCLLGVEFVCPVFTNGVNIVSCRINRTAVRAVRCLSDESVTFEQAGANGTISPKCGVGSFDSSACIPVQKPSANTCWCNESDGNIFDYKFAYVATDTLDVGGRLECRVCLPLKEELDMKASENCRNMRFGSQDLQDGSRALIIGCVAAILCVIILACTIFFARRRYSSQSWLDKFRKLKNLSEPRRGRIARRET